MKKSIRQLNFEDERSSIDKELERVQANRHPNALLLDGLRDMRNVGSIFRLADAANLSKIYLYNCDFDFTHKKLVRTSRSTIKYVEYQVLHDLDQISALQNQYEIIGLEITNSSINYTEFQSQKPILLVIGNEQNGISDEVLQLTQKCVHIPMYGIKTSMNVLCATGIVVYHFLTNFITSNALTSNE